MWRRSAKESRFILDRSPFSFPWLNPQQIRFLQTSDLRYYSDTTLVSSPIKSMRSSAEVNSLVTAFILRLHANQIYHCANSGIVAESLGASSAILIEVIAGNCSAIYFKNSSIHHPTQALHTSRAFTSLLLRNSLANPITFSCLLN